MTYYHLKSKCTWSPYILDLKAMSPTRQSSHLNGQPYATEVQISWRYESWGKSNNCTKPPKANGFEKLF